MENAFAGVAARLSGDSPISKVWSIQSTSTSLFRKSLGNHLDAMLPITRLIRFVRRIARVALSVPLTRRKNRLTSLHYSAFEHRARTRFGGKLSPKADATRQNLCNVEIWRSAKAKSSTRFRALNLDFAGEAILYTLRIVFFHVSPYFTRPAAYCIERYRHRRGFIHSAAAKQSGNAWKIRESKRRCIQFARGGVGYLIVQDARYLRQLRAPHDNFALEG